ncbi:MAG: phosphoenolpyruvate carboxykinase [Bacilli bacterium]|nr:phosphoenolpyruvate carboxykinase [Bacilli bacterium]
MKKKAFDFFHPKHRPEFRKVIIDVLKVQVEFTPLHMVTSSYFEYFLMNYFSDTLAGDVPNSTFFSQYQAKTMASLFANILKKDEKVIQEIRSLEKKELDNLLNLVDNVYDYWRKAERYLIHTYTGESYSHRLFIKKFSSFATCVVETYRDIYETIIGKEQDVYRLLPSGGNAGILLKKEKLPLPKALHYLCDIPIMESLVTQPPFIMTTRQNTRKGFFYENEVKVGKEDFDVENAYGVLIEVFDQKGLVYFDKDYMGFLVALGNLFQLTSYDPQKHEKIDFVVLFGTQKGDSCYYYKEENLYVGVCPKRAHIDYFGYAKKIVLTLFNLNMIERKCLPIHGAGIQMRKGDKIKNFVLLGDSGAGKSESLEAIKNLYSKKYQIDTIFDDMGSFHIQNGEVYATGTEIGAFVRLDDLEQAYSLRSVDRAVYLNIDTTNSRVVVPIEDFEMTYHFHHVDAFLLADNFTDSKEGIHFYDDPIQAMEDFKKGERMAMGTSSEMGLVSTYFANPFGPMQKKEEVEAFLPDYFKALFDHKVPVGRLYTRLSLDRKEGPKVGAKNLVDLFEKL